MMTLFLLGTLVVIAVAWAYRGSNQLHSLLNAHTAKTRFPEMVSVALLAIQASELVSIVQHASFANIIAASITLTILLAVRSGTEGEMH
jgi:hypothetical protein